MINQLFLMSQSVEKIHKTASKLLASQQFESDESAYGYNTDRIIVANIYLVYFEFILVTIWSHADALTTEIPCVQG